LVLLAACAGVQRGATPENLSKAESAAPNGSALYKRHCASCHGERGESVGRAPRILGPGALPELPAERNVNADPAAGDPELLRLRAQTRPAGAPWRDPFRTADDLYRFVSKNMPLPVDKAGSLPPAEYWAIVNYMLVAHGVAVPAGGVNAENASSVRLVIAAQ
jgi:mono/diheme cytochrome c family protein